MTILFIMTILLAFSLSTSGEDTESGDPFNAPVYCNAEFVTDEDLKS